MAGSRSAVDVVLKAAGVVGPLAFVTDWAVLGAIRSHYSPINDAISRLAQTAAPTRSAMTAGFIVYGAALVAYAGTRDSDLPRTSRLLLAATGLSTFGVAAFSLNASGQGTTHSVFAGIGYATLAGAPLVAAGAWARTPGPSLWVRASLAAGIVSAAFLIASTFAPAHGLLQRIGLTAGDAWVVATATRALRLGR
ncbi:MAG: DUF998 domain-containing protein [Actinomycetota bacterium]|nr:DUF998 domain-containing protein [Actinomycetota bacterium]